MSHIARRTAEGRTEQPVEVGNVGEAGLQCDIGDAALALARLSQQRGRRVAGATATRSLAR